MDSMPGPDTKLTIDDYLRIPADGLRHELIEGVHFVSPPPYLDHQAISSELHLQLGLAVHRTRRGDIFAAPVGVELSNCDIVEPDLVVVRSARRTIETKARIVGAPDLVIEILSPSNPEHDRVRKQKLYARAGVTEYWIVDPEHRVVEQYLLRKNRYAPAIHHTDDIRLAILPDVQVDLRAVWHEAARIP